MPRGPAGFTLRERLAVIRRDALDDAEPSLADRLADHAVDLMDERATVRIAFAELCERAGVSRTTGYHAFPKGRSSLLQFLHVRAMADVIGRIRDATRELDETVTYGDAVTAGFRAVVGALSEETWLSRVLRRDERLLRYYLQSREDGAVIDVLSGHAAMCAVTFGTVRADVDGLTRRFVSKVVDEVLETYPADAAGWERWPQAADPAVLRALESHLPGFLDELELEPGARRLRRAAEIVPVPESIGDGLLLPA